MRTILYLHGFASSPDGRKVAALKERLGPEGFKIVAPDLNVPSFAKLSFQDMAKTAVAAVQLDGPALVVGSSLGALVALETARSARDIPLVLIAPALGFGRRWTEKLPEGDPLTFPHYGENKSLEIHRKFFEEMAQVDADRNPPESLVTVIMGTQDESVPFELVQNVWKGWEVSGRLVPGSRLVSIPYGDHSLVAHADLIADEVRALASA